MDATSDERLREEQTNSDERLREERRADHFGRITMAKRGRKKRDRKHSKANHGMRPNAGAKK
jgi:hypothetical protein